MISVLHLIGLPLWLRAEPPLEAIKSTVHVSAYGKKTWRWIWGISMSLCMYIYRSVHSLHIGILDTEWIAGTAAMTWKASHRNNYKPDCYTCLISSVSLAAKLLANLVSLSVWISFRARMVIFWNGYPTPFKILIQNIVVTSQSMRKALKGRTWSLMGNHGDLGEEGRFFKIRL